MLEQAVLLCRDMEQFDKLGGYAERGALLYRQGHLDYFQSFLLLSLVVQTLHFNTMNLGGNPESAAQLLEKAAKLLEMKFPEEALSLYSKAAETVGCEDRPKEASEYLSKVAKLQVKCETFISTAVLLLHFFQIIGSNRTLG